MIANLCLEDDRPNRLVDPSVVRSRAVPRPLLYSFLFFLSSILACARSAPPPAEKAGTITQRVRIYLIAPGDKGRSGKEIGCGDSVMPVEVTLLRRGPALEGALEALTALGQRYEPTSGLYNALYGSRLQVKKVERSGGRVVVHLAGYLEIGGACEAPRIRTQLEETVLQFEDVQEVQLYLEGIGLPSLLNERK